MDVKIIGYNTTTGEHLSPEIIAAAYARTSRDPRSIPEIRDNAKLDVEKARNSNRNIVFEMGHASIAEHAVFNIDIIGVSRYIVELIEKHRLVSYTEKSQRYVLFDGGYVIPIELGLKSRRDFIGIIEEQVRLYKKMYPVVLNYFKEKNPCEFAYSPKTVEGWAKEDCRYILSLATKTQLGMTINAANLELMIRRLRLSTYNEARELSNMLFTEAHSIAPSLFPYVSPSNFEIENSQRDNKYCGEPFNGENFVEPMFNTVSFDPFLLEMFKDVDIKKLMLNMESYDKAPREFELIDFHFKVLVSASCYAQLKRHRMMTIIPKPYHTGYDVIIPKSIIETGFKEEFLNLISVTNKFYENFDCPYVLTNSHSRICYIKLNLREMYHLCRMRQDEHAQWEIRYLANEMARQAKEKSPIGMMLACGKHKFNETKKCLNIFD
jgi:flavin-dependent thymidylate synthase